MRDSNNQSLILDSLFTNWKFGFVFDSQLPSNFLYLSFSTFCYIFFWRTDAIVFAKLLYFFSYKAHSVIYKMCSKLFNAIFLNWKTEN